LGSGAAGEAAIAQTFVYLTPRATKLLLIKLIGFGWYTGFQYTENKSNDYSD
jgi:hypothetical protein